MRPPEPVLYMSAPTPLPPSLWFTFALLTLIYFALLFFFSRNRRLCAPVPDSLFVHEKRLVELRKDVSNILVDELSIETTDQPLGRGANGFVFKGYCFPNTAGRFKTRVPAAIKVSLPIPTSAVRLMEEASRLSRLDHPNIVGILAVSGPILRPIIALERLSGGSLQNYFRNFIRAREDERDRPVVLLRDLLDILLQVASALRHLHETLDNNGREMIHGDIAARNVLLDKYDLKGVNVKLGDFGLPEGKKPLAWLPPEIICAHHNSTKQTQEGDIWMYGVFMWECLTLGATPHYQRSIEDIQRCLRLPDRGLCCPASCPLDVWTVVLECLSEAHRRPRCADVDDGPCSLIYRISSLREVHGSSIHRISALENVSSCTCPEHRCKGATSMLTD